MLRKAGRKKPPISRPRDQIAVTIPRSEDRKTPDIEKPKGQIGHVTLYRRDRREPLPDPDVDGWYPCPKCGESWNSIQFPVHLQECRQAAFRVRRS